MKYSIEWLGCQGHGNTQIAALRDCAQKHKVITGRKRAVTVSKVKARRARFAFKKLTA